MKKLFVFVLSAFIFVSISVVSYAHPGRTDSRGGHRVTSTGGYHYHHGQPAHQHIDEDGDGDLECPYDFGNNSVPATRNRVSTPAPTIRPRATTAPTPTPKPDKTTGLGSKITLIVVFVFFGGTFAITTVNMIAAAVSGVTDNKRKKKEFEVKRNAYQNLYGGVEAIDFVKIPPGCFVGEDNLPFCSGDQKWGEKYTFYISSTGNKYHKDFRCSGATIPVNIANIGKREPCKKCKPEPESIDWYWEYRKIEQIKKEYKIR